MPQIHELFDLPDAPLTKSQFVVKLGEALTPQERAQVVATWVATPALVECMGDALDLMKAALTRGESQAAFLDGSFGSGKSHFMAMLGLLLRDEPEAWARPELDPLRAKHPWIGQKRILEVPFHFISANTIAEHLLAGYLSHMEKAHPDAPPPALFEDDEVFANAAQMLETVEEEVFFGKINAAIGADAEDNDGLGDYGGTVAWDRARFDAVRSGTDIAERDELFGALIKAWFPSFRRQRSRFLNLDDGLAAISRHAKSLNYDGVLLMLDELILWLMGKQHDTKFVTDQCQQLVKLMEFQNTNRPVPIVATIARQRRLEDVVGLDDLGTEQDTLRSSVEWLTERFKVIPLSDTNLPEIVEKRILKPRNEEATRARERILDQLMSKIRGHDRDVLYGEQGDEATFRQLHPFSPVLVQTLVTLSGELQRERTAIRILMELLVEHVGDMSADLLVPVGDLFDILVEGTEKPMDAVLRKDFESIRTLYHDKLLPLIQKSNLEDVREECQRERPSHKVALGCSGCPKVACRNDNRIAKTILLASLIRHRPPLDDLTMRRVVALNHGHIKAGFGNAVSKATATVKRWMTEVPEIEVGEEQDPSVSVRIGSVDLSPLLKKYQGEDSPAARRRQFQRLLFKLLQLEGDGSLTSLRLVWRGTQRTGSVRFGNVHQLRDEEFDPATGHDFHLVIDYPFDQDGKGPEHDEERLQTWQAARPQGAPTIVWMPSFLSEQGSRLLGELVLVENLSQPERWREESRAFNEEDRPSLKQQLGQRLQSRESSLRLATEVAFQLRKPSEAPDLIDEQRAPDDPVVPLQAGLERRAVGAGNFPAALEELATRILDTRFPHHPNLGNQKVTRGRVTDILSQFEDLLEREGQRGSRALDTSKAMTTVAEPLGLVRVTEQEIRVDTTLFDEVDKALRRDGVFDEPTVRELRRAFDPDQKKGFVPEVSDLLVLAWAKQRNREFFGATDRLSSPTVGKVDDELVARAARLPALEAWEATLERAEGIFALPRRRYVLNAKNVQRLTSDLRKRIDEWSGLVPTALTHLEERSLDVIGTSETDRIATMQSLDALVTQVKELDGIALVERLAAAELSATPHALSAAWTALSSLTPKLKADSTWTTLATAATGTEAEAVKLKERLHEVLRRDELQRRAVAELRELEQIANELLRAKPSPKKVPSSSGVQRVEFKTTGAQLQQDLAEHLGKISPEDQVDVSLDIRRGRGTPE